MDLSELIALDEAAVRCPYSLYDKARAEGTAFDPAVDAYVVSRYTDAVDVLRDTASFSSKEVLGRPLPPPDAQGTSMPPLLLVSDPPVHTEKRALVARAFTPRQIKAWEPAVAELCGDLLDRMLQQPDPDFVRDVAAPLPVRVITAVLGVPGGDAGTFRHWSEEVTRSLGGHDTTPDERMAASRAFGELVSGFLDDPGCLAHGSVLAVISAAEAEGRLTRLEAVRLTMELIVAGNITTTDHLGNSLLLLASRPEIFDRLRADRSLVAAFVEESLRLEGPVQCFYRRATAPTVVGGAEIPADRRVLVLYGAANRDPHRFESPDELRLDRGREAGHVAFGFGPHTCLGAPLARMEARVALDALLDRVEAVELVDPEHVPYLRSYINHGPTSLPIRVRRASAEVDLG